MRLVETRSSVIGSRNETQEIRDTSTELLMHIVGVLAQYNSGSVRIVSYHRGRCFRAEFTSAGDKYSWFFEESEDPAGLLRIFMLLCYYCALQMTKTSLVSFEEWSMQAHRDLGLNVKSPVNVERCIRTILWGQLKVALLHALNIGFNDAYADYSPEELAEAWGLHELMGISFDEALTPTS